MVMMVPPQARYAGSPNDSGVMMVPPQARYAGSPNASGDGFFMSATSPRVGMPGSSLGELANLVTSTNVAPWYREAAIANPNYNMPGSAEAHARYGIPPVVVQSDPYATLAFAAGPGGSVAPLIGYPSRYPHVLNGVPTPYGGGTLGGMLAGLMQMGRAGQFQLHPLVMQAMQQRRAGGTGGTGGGGTKRANTAPKAQGMRRDPYEQTGNFMRRDPYEQTGNFMRRDPYEQTGNFMRRDPYEQTGNFMRRDPYEQTPSTAPPLVLPSTTPVEATPPAQTAPVSGEYRAAANMTPVAPVPVVPGNAVAAAAQRLGWVDGLPSVQQPLMVQAPTMRLPAVMLQR